MLSCRTNTTTGRTINCAVHGRSATATAGDSATGRFIGRADGNITSKSLDLIPESRDTPELIERRRLYCLDAIHWPRDTLIFIDEVGFDRNQKRRRGRSRRGRPATLTVPDSQGPRINVCAAVSPQYGMVQYEPVLGTWDSFRFRDFMSRLTRQNSFTKYHSVRIILDGVRWHYSERVKEVL